MAHNQVQVVFTSRKGQTSVNILLEFVDIPILVCHTGT